MRLVPESLSRHYVCTAETHNFPCAKSSFSWWTTGIGGRIRDVQAVGRGGLPIAAAAVIVLVH